MQLSLLDLPSPDCQQPQLQQPYKLRTLIDSDRGVFANFDPTQNHHSIEHPTAYWQPLGQVWRAYSDLPWEYAPTGIQDSRITQFGVSLEETIALLLRWVEEVKESDRLLRQEWGLPPIDVKM